MAITFDNIAISIVLLLAVAYLIYSVLKKKTGCGKCLDPKVLKKEASNKL